MRDLIYIRSRVTLLWYPRKGGGPLPDLSLVSLKWKLQIYAFSEIGRALNFIFNQKTIIIVIQIQTHCYSATFHIVLNRLNEISLSSKHGNCCRYLFPTCSSLSLNKITKPCLTSNSCLFPCVEIRPIHPFELHLDSAHTHCTPEIKQSSSNDLNVDHFAEEDEINAEVEGNKTEVGISFF